MDGCRCVFTAAALLASLIYKGLLDLLVIFGTMVDVCVRACARMCAWPSVSHEVN